MSLPVDRIRYVREGAGGHYESCWFRLNDPDAPRAVWIRYTVFKPEGSSKEAMKEAIAEVWAMVFERGVRSPVAVRIDHPITECAYEDRDGAPYAKMPSAEMSSSSIRGDVVTGSHHVKWDLAISGGGAPAYLLPLRLYEGRFPKAKSIASRPGVRFEGSVWVDGSLIDVSGWRGSANHNWGSRHTAEYAYSQVIGFQNAPESMLEVATARAHMGPFLTPPTTVGVLRHEGSEYVFTDPLRGAFVRAAFGIDGYRFELKRRDVTVRGSIVPERSDLVAVRYLDPPGGVKHCVNTKIARAEIVIALHGKKEELLISHHGALFEWISLRGDHGLPLSL